MREEVQILPDIVVGVGGLHLHDDRRADRHGPADGLQGQDGLVDDLQADDLAGRGAGGVPDHAAEVVSVELGGGDEAQGAGPDTALVQFNAAGSMWEQ